MTFDDILAQVITLLQREGRVSYRALKRRFDLDNDYLEDLKAEIIKAKKLAIDEAGEVLVWTEATGAAAMPAGTQDRTPLAYTPLHLTEKILASRPALEGERKQVTVLFADIKDSTELIKGLDPEAGQQGLTVARALEDFPLQVWANVHLGQVYHAVGEYRRAIDLLRQNVASLQGDLRYERSHIMTTLPAVVSHARLVWCLADLGAFAEAIPLGEEAIRIAEVVDSPFDRISGHLAIGYLWLRKGDLSKAIAILERGLQLCQVAHVRALMPRIASALGAAYVLSERLAAALPLLKQGVEQATSLGIMVGHGLWLACLGEAYLCVGRQEDAIALTERALALARTHKERGDEAYTLQILGAIHARREPPEAEQAEIHYRQALTLARNSACARSRPTAISALAHYMPG